MRTTEVRGDVGHVRIPAGERATAQCSLGKASLHLATASESSVYAEQKLLALGESTAFGPYFEDAVLSVNATQGAVTVDVDHLVGARPLPIIDVTALPVSGVTGVIYAAPGGWRRWNGQLFVKPEDPNPPVNTVLPAITGTAEPEETLTCSAGTWSHAVTASYQWLADGDEIEGETSATYDVAEGDIGKVISCVVTGASDYGSGTAQAVGVLVEEGEGGGE